MLLGKNESSARVMIAERSEIETVDEAANVKRFEAIKDHLFSDMADEAVLLSMRNGKYYGLNHVGAAIWAIIREAATLSDIEAALTEKYEIDPETCRIEVTSFLDKMIREELVNVIDG